MKTCAACHEDLPKDKFSKKQWTMSQRRCKVCVTDNREVQPLPDKAKNNKAPKVVLQQNDNDTDSNGVISCLLSSLSIQDCNMPISDEEIFKQPPQKEDCPICFLRLPSLWTGYKYMSCCGKTILCSGCLFANFKMHGRKNCAFCRAPAPIYLDQEVIRKIKKRIEVDDAQAIGDLGTMYSMGQGVPQDTMKALELWQQAGKLGNPSSFNSIGYAYFNGVGVAGDEKKGIHYWELAAIMGHAFSRDGLGDVELKKGNINRAVKHFVIASAFGCSNSLDAIRGLCKEGKATKEDYMNALKGYQEYLDDIKSDQRDGAAAFNDELKYY